MRKNNLLTAKVNSKFLRMSLLGNGKKILELDEEKALDEWYEMDHGNMEVAAHYYVPYTGWHYFVVGAEFTEDEGWMLMCARVIDGVNDWFCCPLSYFIKLACTPISYNRTLGVKLEECNGENLDFYMQRYLCEALY